MQTKAQAKKLLLLNPETYTDSRLYRQRHTHRYTCGHARGVIQCYQAYCPDPADIRCAACLAAFRQPATGLCYCVCGHVHPDHGATECGVQGCDCRAYRFSVVCKSPTPPPLDYHRQEYEPGPGPTPRQLRTLASINLWHGVLLVLTKHEAAKTYKLHIHDDNSLPTCLEFSAYETAYARLLAEAAARREP